MKLYDFKERCEVREEDIELYLVNYWLWRSRDKKRRETVNSPFALNDLESF